MATNMTQFIKSADVDVSWYAPIVHQCIMEEKLSKLRATLKKFGREQRKKIVAHKIRGNAPLFTACLEGKLHFVNYLMDDCSADIEQHGVYEVEEDHSCHKVTPLWCSAVSNKLDIIKTLVQHGADVNSPSDTESTPVRSACFMTNISVVKFLVDNGADIHKPNVNGGTCLINSVQSMHLCEFLIGKGANVNAKDNSGNLALHYAIREGRFETVKLLIRCGSNYTAKNDIGDNALQTAALRGYSNIAEYIIENTTQAKIDCIHAYELLGTNLVDEKHDMSAAISSWKKAMELRYSDADNPQVKSLPAESNYAYNFAVEPQTMDELLSKVVEPDSVYMQALLIRERILGPNHKDTTFSLMYRGAVYADTQRYQRCVDLWKYAYVLRNQKGDALNHECLFTVQAIVKLLWEIQAELESGSTEEIVQFSDAVEVFDILVQQINNAMMTLKENLNSKNDYENFQLLLQLSLHLIHLVSRLEMNESENTAFFKKVHNLISLNPRGSRNETLLHLSVDPKISLTSEEFYSPFPSLAVIQILLRCGAAVNALDKKKNTPLHDSLMFLTYSELQDEGILNCLLENGAHVDMRNTIGETPLSLIISHSLPIHLMKYLSLRCFAASVIAQENIKYRGEVPESLYDFIEMHSTEKADPH